MTTAAVNGSVRCAAGLVIRFANLADTFTSEANCPDDVSLRHALVTGLPDRSDKDGVRGFLEGLVPPVLACVPPQLDVIHKLTIQCANPLDNRIMVGQYGRHDYRPGSRHDPRRS